MKIAFYVYPTAFQNPGGGEILLLKTKEALENEGVSVTLLDPWRADVKDFDILHTFGSVKEALPMMEVAHTRGVKNVLTTICWYSWKSAWGIYPEWNKRIPSVLRHLVKVILPGVPSKRKRMMQISERLIPNSEIEALQLEQFFGVARNKISIVYNAVDEKFESADPLPFIQEYGLKDFVLVVGRIEPRKNQLRVVRALKGAGMPVVFIGDYVNHYEEYYKQCRSEADSNMHFLGKLPHDSELLRSSYAACNTFLLATWLETPGLSALEAGFAGAKVVLTEEGATREYFGDYVSYVKPDSIEDIREKTVAAFKASLGAGLQAHIREKYIWKMAAKENIKVYESLLGNCERVVAV